MFLAIIFHRFYDFYDKSWFFMTFLCQIWIFLNFITFLWFYDVWQPWFFLKSHWAQLWIDDCSSGAKEQWLMCCLCQKTSYLTHVFSMLYWALKKALILGLETRKKYENFRNFVRIHITKPHVIKCFTLFKMKEKLTQRFSKKITGIFDHLQAFPLSPLDTKMLQKHNRSVLYLMKNE